MNGELDYSPWNMTHGRDRSELCTFYLPYVSHVYELRRLLYCVLKNDTLILVIACVLWGLLEIAVDYGGNAVKPSDLWST